MAYNPGSKNDQDPDGVLRGYNVLFPFFFGPRADRDNKVGDTLKLRLEHWGDAVRARLPFDQVGDKTVDEVIREVLASPKGADPAVVKAMRKCISGDYDVGVMVAPGTMIAIPQDDRLIDHVHEGRSANGWVRLLMCSSYR